ncbi:SMI1/KNR4 family protein [Kitasatospora sp. NA04385]|uniref:SMI1/KNR4 family protein n=1 Tax=Kitasatospora sp. NA04385 TaxID=2742135 RepID=UPI0015923108|nr:SMI1/KNR4 family protein [Kitasatospora sp. NA04385]QKW18071.1 SMI1/KNR4 family protein [Kitasatospora sp. NA04385]
MGTNRVRWREFLELWSTEWITARQADPSEPPLDPEVLRDGWLGFSPASETEVAAAEARLGRPLPPSLREFLLVTDGWRDAGPFIQRVAGAAELDWLRDTPERHWIDIWAELAGLTGDDRAEDDEDGDGDGDEDGEGEGEYDEVAAAEARILARSLRLSLAGDCAVLLLDPEDVDADGEWAGYWLASWSGEGPQRHASFAELIRDQWRTVHALDRPAGPTRDHWDAEVERGRRAALAGELDLALDLLGQAETFGRPRARLLLLQLRLLLDGWRTGKNRVPWNHRDAEPLLAEPLLTEGFLPLLVRLVREADGHEPYTLDRIRANGPQALRTALAEYEAMTGPGFRFRYGPPEFDAAVHAVVDGLVAHLRAQRAAVEQQEAAERAARPSGELRLVLTTTDVVRPSDPARPGGQQWEEFAATPVGRTPAGVLAARLAGAPHSEVPTGYEPVPPHSAARPGRPWTEIAPEVAERAWSELLAALPLWRPASPDHLAPVSLLADPLLDGLITPERARALLSLPRG